VSAGSDRHVMARVAPSVAQMTPDSSQQVRVRGESSRQRQDRGLAAQVNNPEPAVQATIDVVCEFLVCFLPGRHELDRARPFVAPLA
jgi:hypothetical protein